MTKYGPHNPHPLSTMRTELVWEGKYDEFGNRREVNVAGLAMPLQKIETIDEPRSRAEGQGELFDEKKAHRDDFRNRLIWGDNKLVTASLFEEFRGAIDLIYIDPPFDIGADFTMNVPIGDEREVVTKDPSLLETVAYRDIWGRGTDSYLAMLYERLALLRELLSANGSIFVHVGPNISHFVRCVMVDVFGSENFRNEIIWRRAFAHNDPNRCGNIHDCIFYFTKTESRTWNTVLQKPSLEYIEQFFDQYDPVRKE